MDFLEKNFRTLITSHEFETELYQQKLNILKLTHLFIVLFGKVHALMKV